MHSEHLEITESPLHIALPLSTWFTDAGITSEGRRWVALSAAFFEKWSFDECVKKMYLYFATLQNYATRTKKKHTREIVKIG